MGVSKMNAYCYSNNTTFTDKNNDTLVVSGGHEYYFTKARVKICYARTRVDANLIAKKNDD